MARLGGKWAVPGRRMADVPSGACPRTSQPLPEPLFPAVSRHQVLCTQQEQGRPGPAITEHMCHSEEATALLRALERPLPSHLFTDLPDLSLSSLALCSPLSLPGPLDIPVVLSPAAPRRPA